MATVSSHAVAVHVGEHQDPPRRGVLDDCGDEPVGSLEVGKVGGHGMLRMRGYEASESPTVAASPPGYLRAARRPSTHVESKRDLASTRHGRDSRCRRHDPRGWKFRPNMRLCRCTLQRPAGSADGTKQVPRTSPHLNRRRRPLNSRRHDRLAGPQRPAHPPLVVAGVNGIGGDDRPSDAGGGRRRRVDRRYLRNRLRIGQRVSAAAGPASALPAGSGAAALSRFVRDYGSPTWSPTAGSARSIIRNWRFSWVQSGERRDAPHAAAATLTGRGARHPARGLAAPLPPPAGRRSTAAAEPSAGCESTSPPPRVASVSATPVLGAALDGLMPAMTSFGSPLGK